MNKHKHEVGAAHPLLIASILLGLLAAGFAGGFAWAYGNYVDQRDNVSKKVISAVSEARKQQTADDEKQFIEREKLPTRKLVGPNDLGSVSVDYPKTWSVYVSKDGDNGQYEAYLQPGIVPAVESTTAYATRVVINETSYESSLKSYEGLVKKGDLKSSPITIGKFTGVRLDGKFSQTRNGSAVLFKVRDKTLTVATDASSYKGDFDSIVLKTLTFNP